MRLFRSGTFSIAVVYGMAANFTFYGMVFVLSLYFQHARHYGATETGFAYLPLMATFVAVNLVNGWVVGRFGVRIPMVAGFLVDALGFSLLLLLGPASAYWLALPAFVLMPAGMGTGIPAMIGAMLGSVDRSVSGVAAAVTNAARQAGGAIGVAVFGALVGDDVVGGDARGRGPVGPSSWSRWPRPRRSGSPDGSDGRRVRRAVMSTRRDGAAEKHSLDACVECVLAVP